MMAQQPKPNLKEKLALIDRFLARGDILAAEVHRAPAPRRLSAPG
jgi:hypothetical protein